MNILSVHAQDTALQFPDIVKNIYSFLPLKDQSLTIPNVCRVWRTVADQCQKSFETLAQEILENKRKTLQFFTYSDDELKIIIQLSSKNNLISLIKQNAGRCDLHRGSKSFCDFIISNEFHDELLCDKRDHAGGSNYFNIFWKPKSLELSNKASYKCFRTSFVINISTNKFYYEYKNFFKSFNLETSSSCFYKKKKLFSWKKVAQEKIKPLKMDQYIKEALSLDLKMYVAFFAQLNLDAISEKNISDLKLGTPFSCTYNSNGLIIDSQNDSKDNCLKIFKKDIKDGFSVLCWQSSDYTEDREHYCDIKIVLRWAIFSLTCEKLAEKTGLRIHEIKSL